jgi:uncharacterized membrane protein
MTKRARARSQRKRPDTERTVDAGRNVRGRPLPFLVLGGLLLAAVVTRVQFLDRSLWLDEAWVANSILAASLPQAIYYDDWLQTTPPLFVALSRLVTSVLGTSNAAFRALPALSGIGSVLLFSFIALRLLKPSFAIIAILLFVFSPRVILYSQSLKQYSTDVLSTISLLALGYLYIEKRTDRRFYLLLVAFVVLSFLSYPAMLFLPFLLYVAVTKVDLQPRAINTQEAIRPNWHQFFLVIALGVFVFGANYWFFIAPNKSPALAEFFPEGFYQGQSPAEFLAFYGGRLLTLTGNFFFAGSAVLRVVTGLITVIGFIHLWVPTKSPGLETSRTAVLLTVPVAGIIGLNLLGFFPLPGFHHRLLLFVFPITVLVFCLGLQFLANLTSRLIGSRWTSVKAISVENVLGSAVFIGLLGLVWLFFNIIGLKPFFAEEYEDSEGAIAYVSQRLQANDVVYVHATMREQFKLYNRSPPDMTRIVYGKIGMPCCPRTDYRNPQQESAKDIADEILAVSNVAAGRFLWILITDRALNRVYARRNDIEIFERGLTDRGCAKLDETKLTGVYIGHFECKPK